MVHCACHVIISVETDQVMVVGPTTPDQCGQNTD